MRRGTVLIVLGLLAACLPASAQVATQQVTLYDSGTARALGMGNAFTAVANDLESVLWNPAGIARLSGRQATYNDVLRNFPKSMRFAAFGQPGKDGPAGALSYLNVNSRVYGIKQTSYTYTFAQDMSTSLAVGANVKFSRFDRSPEGREVFDFDLGALYSLGNGVVLGASVLNATNPTIVGGAAPAKAARLVNVGAAFHLHPYSQAGEFGNAPVRYQTVIALDVFDATDEVNRQLRFGVEHNINERLVGRIGLLSSTPTAGLTLKMHGYAIDAGVLIGRPGERGTESMVGLNASF